MWGGLRGAVPIMLGTLALLEGIDDGERVYDMIFVVVAFSVLVQGTSIPYVARRLGVPMRDSDPGGIVSRVVAPGSSAAGRTLRDLPLGERTWVRAVSRGGKPVPARGDTVLEERDEVELVLDVSDVDRLDDLFGSARAVKEGETTARQRPDEVEQHAKHRVGHRLPRKGAEPSYTRSMIPAIAWPCPMHIVAMP